MIEVVVVVERQDDHGNVVVVVVVGGVIVGLRDGELLGEMMVNSYDILHCDEGDG